MVVVGMNKQLRALLWWRSEGYCEKCGRGIEQDGFAAHHRKLRSQGGQDEITNLVALCHSCHNLGTASVHLNPEQAKANGWIVPNWKGLEPANVLICTDAGLIVSLNSNGTKQTMKEQQWLENQQSNSQVD